MVKKIISGGQTGADRAALDFAIKHKIPHGGWVPKGRLAEDGPLWIGSSTVEAGLSKWLIQGLQKDDGSCGAMLIS